MESFSSSDGAATAAWQATLKKDPKDLHKNLQTRKRGSFVHRSEPIAWRGGKSPQDGAGKRSHRFTSGTTLRFGGVPHRRVGQPRSAAVSGCGRSCPTRTQLFFTLYWHRGSGMNGCPPIRCTLSHTQTMLFITLIFQNLWYN
ncbi:hypothetical protein DesyoDRAFT_4611 [Desulfosporosinus youngiae DSM 17734]|uniref:Uncharacterized protein n=1 Tax=Desulfosporosinus youngiae DSM 17734 TaxID=768710 RepID=H5XYK9_9FIRM|nr:hypothetical protein DesyoDRAFT_4611 [Desulfosporosinus youngiae DSM 17734]